VTLPGVLDDDRYFRDAVAVDQTVVSRDGDDLVAAQRGERLACAVIDTREPLEAPFRRSRSTSSGSRGRVFSVLASVAT
jgi:hypothetical protein